MTAADFDSAAPTVPVPVPVPVPIIDRLSDELWLDIFARVALQPDGYRTLAACSATCTSFRRLCQDDAVGRAAFMGINRQLALEPLTGSWPSLAEMPPALSWWHVVKDQVRFMRSWMRCLPGTEAADGKLVAVRRNQGESDHDGSEEEEVEQPHSPTIVPQPDPAAAETALETLMLADQGNNSSEDEPDLDQPNAGGDLGTSSQAIDDPRRRSDDDPFRFTVAEAPFHTTLIDLACPMHLLPPAAIDPNDPLVLSRIDRVHVHVPRPTSASTSGERAPNGAIAVSANWVRKSRLGQLLSGRFVTRTIHVLDATSLCPISVHVPEKDPPHLGGDDFNEEDDDEEDGAPHLRSLQAVDAVNKCFVVMSHVDNDPEHGAFVASLLQLVSYDPATSGAGKVVAKHTFPGAPDSASLPIQIHNDNTYKLIYTDAASHHFTIRHLHAPTLTLARPDVAIRTTDMIHHYEPDFPSILVTGDQFGAIRVWCTATGTLKYAYQVAHMLTNSFAMLRPLIRPWIIDSPHVWARDKWLQVYSLVCGFEWDSEEQPGASLHSVVGASAQVPATIAPDDPLYEQPDWPRFMRLFEEKRDGLAWMGSFASMRGLASVEEAPKPACLYRDRSRGNNVAFLAAYQALFSMDDHGRLAVTDLVDKRELGSLVAAGCTAKQAVEVIKAGCGSKKGEAVAVELQELVAADGQVGCAVVRLPKSSIQPRPNHWPADTSPENSTHMSGDMMFVGSAWERFLVYRNCSLMVLEQY